MSYLDSNPGPLDLQSGGLPLDHHHTHHRHLFIYLFIFQLFFFFFFLFGKKRCLTWIRTRDLFPFYLSIYIPTFFFFFFSLWKKKVSYLDSNPGPLDLQSGRLPLDHHHTHHRHLFIYLFIFQLFFFFFFSLEKKVFYLGFEPGTS